MKGSPLCYTSSLSRSTDRNAQTHTNSLDRTQTHSQVCGVCTCVRILSAGPSFSPMVLSRCSSVSSGNVSPSMACSRNTWQRHSCFSHTPDINRNTRNTQIYTFTHAAYETVALFQRATYVFCEKRNLK